MIKRLLNLMKGFFGMFLGAAEKNNPEALLALEKENMRSQIANFNTGLASQAGLVEKLLSQKKVLTTQVSDLEGKIKSMLQAGKREIAAQLSVKYGAAKKNLESVTIQLEEGEVQYKELLRTRDIAVQTAQKKIDSISAGISDMKIQKAKAELTEMATGMIANIGGAGDNLNRIEEMVEEERTKASGRARVAKDTLDTSEFAFQAEQLEADASIALAAFEAEQGLQSVGDKPQTVNRSMSVE